MTRQNELIKIISSIITSEMSGTRGRDILAIFDTRVTVMNASVVDDAHPSVIVGARTRSAYNSYVAPTGIVV